MVSKEPFELYQVKSGKEYRDYRYTEYDLLQEFGLEVDKKNYDLVYSGEIEYQATLKEALETLYGIFNMKHPDDYKGRSMSIGDVVVLKEKAFYCDRLGFKLIKKWNN